MSEPERTLLDDMAHYIKQVRPYSEIRTIYSRKKNYEERL
jgi:uncharacterized protein YeeX (DUF496 family)